MEVGDTLLIDGFIVNGAAKMVDCGARAIRKPQTGYLYHYAFAMIVGAIILLSWWLGGILPALR